MEKTTNRILSLIRYIEQDGKDLTTELVNLVRAANDEGIFLSLSVENAGVSVFDEKRHFIGKAFANTTSSLADLAKAVLTYLKEVSNDAEALS